MANKVIRENSHCRVIHWDNGEYQVIEKRRGFWAPIGKRMPNREVALNLYRRLNKKRG